MSQDPFGEESQISPNDLDAERAVLGALMLGDDFPTTEAVASLRPRHFFRDTHQVIFAKMCTMRDAGQVTDLVMLKSAMTPEVLERAGGLAYIAKLTDGVPRSTNVGLYASLVRTHADARAMIATFDRARSRLYQEPTVASNGFIADVTSELEAIRHSPERRPTFQLIDDVEMIARPEPSMLVSGILTSGSFGVLFAPPGQSKTFTMVELGVCIATGKPFFGNPVPQPGNVVHVLGEGAGLFGRRLAAAKMKHGIAPDTSMGYYTLPEPVDLLNAESVRQFIDAAGKVSPMVIFLDTVNRNMSGNENATEDMTAFVRSVSRIRTELSCAVVGVHHTGWDEKRERGSNVLRAAVDTLLSLRSGDGDLVTFSCERQRDIESFAPIQLRRVALGDSCVMQPASDTFEPSPNERQAIEALQDIYCGRPVASGAWRDASGLAPRTFDRVKKGLLASGSVERLKGKYRPLRHVHDGQGGENGERSRHIDDSVPATDSP